jgi:hypothetical protein
VESSYFCFSLTSSGITLLSNSNIGKKFNLCILLVIYMIPYLIFNKVVSINN